MIKILQLAGLDDTNELQLSTTDESGERRFLEFRWVSPLLDPLDPNRFMHRKLLYGGVNNPIRIDFRPDIVYNSISDPDSCSKVLARVQQAAKDNPFPFINHPDTVANTRIDRLSELARGIEGLFIPNSIRIAPTSLEDLRSIFEKNGVNAPLLFREAGVTYDAKKPFLLTDFDNLHLLERFAFDGRAYYVTPFVDYRSTDGLYRKYRFFVMGSKIIPGHLIISDDWYVTADKTAHTDSSKAIQSRLREEKDFLKRFQKKRIPALLTLQQKIGLDYFAVECSLNEDGSLLLFNVDANAHYMDSCKDEGYYNEKQLKRFREATETMIINKLKKEQVRHV